MYRIDNSTAAVALPTPAVVGPNPNGYFTKGNPSGGTPATVVDDDWANATQEEICYVIEQAGITLSKSDRTQLKKSIDFLIQKQASNTGTASGTDTYTVTLTPTPTAYSTGMTLKIKFTNANTGSSTLNVNSLGAKTIKHNDGTSLEAGDILASMILNLYYDGTDFIILDRHSHIPINTKTTTYSVTASDRGKLISADTTSGAFTITLPNPATVGAGFNVYVRKTKNDTNELTMATSSGNIDGIASVVLAAQNDTAHFLSDGTNWKMLNGNISWILQEVTATTNAVAAGTTVMPYDDTIPQNTEGDEYLTLPLTPKITNSWIHLFACIPVSVDNAATACGAFFVDSTANALAANAVNVAAGGHEIFVLYARVASTSTTAKTYKLRLGQSGGATLTVNGVFNAQRKFGGVSTAIMTATEVSR